MCFITYSDFADDYYHYLRVLPGDYVNQYIGDRHDYYTTNYIYGETHETATCSEPNGSNLLDNLTVITTPDPDEPGNQVYIRGYIVLAEPDDNDKISASMSTYKSENEILGTQEYIFSDTWRYQVDDYADVPQSTQIGTLSVPDNSSADWSNGYLFAQRGWNGYNIPADTDVFEVITLNNADLDPGVYCIITELDSSAQTIPLEITVYEENGNNYGTQIGWTNAFVNSHNSKQTVFFKLTSAKKVFVRVNSTQSSFQGKYKIKCVHSKPILLVHGIRSGPKDPNDESNFEELNIILNKMGYIVKYLYYDSGEDKIANIITIYKSLIENMFTDSEDQKVTIIAHSFGATLTDLCIQKYESIGIDDKIKQVITIGGVHRGSPFANIWCDNFASGWGIFADTTMEIKNSMEIGSAGAKLCSKYKYNGPGVPLIALNGKWGTAALTYYNDKKIWFLPRHFSYHKLDNGMSWNSDGMVPNFSACPNDVAAANQRRLVYTSNSQGMAHDDASGKVSDINTESHIWYWDVEYYQHGFFVTLTNVLAGGNLQKTDGFKTTSVPQYTGAVCKKYNFPLYEEYHYPHGEKPVLYAEKNGTTIRLWNQDEDNDLLGQKEEPYYILVGEAGQYSIDRKSYYEEVWSPYSGKTYVEVHVSTNIGSIIVTGGQAKFDN